MIHANKGVLEKDEKDRYIVNLEKLAPVSRLGDMRSQWPLSIWPCPCTSTP